MTEPALSRVAIVEDDASMSHALERILRLAGYASDSYGSAEDYLSHSRHDAACLIIDVQLPGMTGFELHDRLCGAMQKAPVIFVTAMDDADARLKAGAAHSIAFLAKPFSGRALLESVGRACAQDAAP